MYTNTRTKALVKDNADKEESQPKCFREAAAKESAPLLGIALTIPSVVVAQIAGQAGYGFCLIDMEHSPLSAEMTTNLVHSIVASSRGSCFPLVRVPSQGVEWIKWALDSGAAGILVPMVENKAEIDQIVDRAVFPPHGKRSFGPALAPWGLPTGAHGGVPEYFARARSGDIALIPMIESREGVENAEEIISAQGVTGVFIGPLDLRLSLGLNGMDGSEPKYTQALEKICRIAKGHKKLVGSIAMDIQTVHKRSQEGIDFLIRSVDAGLLAKGMAEARQQTLESISLQQRPCL